MSADTAVNQDTWKIDASLKCSERESLYQQIGYAFIARLSDNITHNSAP